MPVLSELDPQLTFVQSLLSTSLRKNTHNRHAPLENTPEYHAFAGPKAQSASLIHGGKHPHTPAVSASRQLQTNNQCSC